MLSLSDFLAKVFFSVPLIKLYVCMTLWIMNIVVFTTLSYFQRECLHDYRHQILKMVFEFYYLTVVRCVFGIEMLERNFFKNRKCL